MKKTRLFGMFALTFALVFGAVSCAQPESGDAPADVKSDAASLVGKWKCTEYTVESDENYDAAIKTLMGITDEKAEELTADAKEQLMRSMDFELADEAAAKVYLETLDAQVKAFNDNKAKAKELLDAQKKEMEEMFKVLGATLDEFDEDGDLDIYISSGRDKIVIETSESGSLKITYNGESASASMSGSTRTVWEKQ